MENYEKKMKENDKDNIDAKEAPVQWNEFETVNATNLTDNSVLVKNETLNDIQNSSDSNKTERFKDVDLLSTDHIKIEEQAKIIAERKIKEMNEKSKVKFEANRLKTNSEAKSQVKAKAKSKEKNKDNKNNKNNNYHDHSGPHIDLDANFMADFIKKLVNNKMNEKQNGNNHNGHNSNNNHNGQNSRNNSNENNSNGQNSNNKKNNKRKSKRKNRKSKRNIVENQNPSQGFLVITGSTGTNIKNNHVENNNSKNSGGAGNSSNNRKNYHGTYYMTRPKKNYYEKEKNAPENYGEARVLENRHHSKKAKF